MKLLTVLCAVLFFPGGWSMAQNTGGYPINVQHNTPSSFGNDPPKLMYQAQAQAQKYPHPQQQPQPQPQPQPQAQPQPTVQANPFANLYIPNPPQSGNSYYNYPDPNLQSPNPYQPNGQYGQQDLYGQPGQYRQQSSYPPHQPPAWGPQLGQQPYRYRPITPKPNYWHQPQYNNPWEQLRQPQRQPQSLPQKQPNNNDWFNYMLFEGNARDMLLMQSGYPPYMFMDVNPVDMMAWSSLTGSPQPPPQGRGGPAAFNGAMSPFLASIFF